MNSELPPDPLDHPEYLRNESGRLRRIIKTLSDPSIKKELATHSLYLAQRAEAIDRIMEDPAVVRMNVDRHRAALKSELRADNRAAVVTPLAEAELALDAPPGLRELAVWYRSFAERAGNPAIWEARLQTAEDLDREAERIERRDRSIDPNHRRKRAAG
jgi:hypothetical protein